MGRNNATSIVARSFIALAAALMTLAIAAPADARHAIWSDVFGTAGQDLVGGIAVDDLGRAYVVGETNAAFPGETLRGASDVFVKAYGPGGGQRWFRQFGGGDESAAGVAVDGERNVHVAVRVRGGGDFVRSFTPDGRVRWTRQVAAGTDIAADHSGTVYVLDEGLTKLAPTGAVIWTRSFDIGDFSIPTKVSAGPDGGAYVLGVWRQGQDPDYPEEQRAFVRRFGPDGTVLWSHRFLLGDTVTAQALAVDVDGNAYVGGAFFRIAEDDWAAFLRRVSATGRETWTRRFPGAAELDEVFGLATASGRLYAAGSGFADTGAGSVRTAVLMSLRPDGTGVWSRTFRGASGESAAADAEGNAYLSGGADPGFLGRPGAGGTDAYVIKAGRS